MNNSGALVGKGRLGSNTAIIAQAKRMTAFVETSAMTTMSE